jgi:hypothetical protein
MLRNPPACRLRPLPSRLHRRRNQRKSRQFRRPCPRFPSQRSQRSFRFHLSARPTAPPARLRSSTSSAGAASGGCRGMRRLAAEIPLGETGPPSSASSSKPVRGFEPIGGESRRCRFPLPERGCVSHDRARGPVRVWKQSATSTSGHEDQRLGRRGKKVATPEAPCRSHASRATSPRRDRASRNRGRSIASRRPSRSLGRYI